MQVGIDSFAAAFDENGRAVNPAERPRQVVQQIEHADEVGLDAFGVGEHHRRGGDPASHPKRPMRPDAADDNRSEAVIVGSIDERLPSTQLEFTRVEVQVPVEVHLPIVSRPIDDN